MRHLNVQPKRLFFYVLLSAVIVLLGALALYVVLAQSEASGIPFPMAMTQSMGILLFGFSVLAGPLLLLRGGYYLFLMITQGRQPGVGVFSAKLLFNPFNLLIFPSLLTDSGRNWRQRCLVALVLFALLIAVMLLTSQALA